MEICNHLIAENEIVGIGPLMSQSSTNEALKMLYNSRQYWFWLHLRNQNIKIESCFVETRGVPDELLQQNNQHLKDFENNYNKAKDEVALLIQNGVIK